MMAMIHGLNDMMEEEPYAISQSEQATQQVTQSQEEQQDEWNEHMWGTLKPMRSNLKRVDFWKAQTMYTIGRSSENLVIFPNLKISNRHCVLTWSGQANDGMVTVHDLSSNGTFINGQKIGRGKSGLLHDGNEIAFGQWASVPGPDDYRFIFRYMANGKPTHGLYAFYDVGNELGRGSFATVVRAVCREDGREYAIKMIHRNKFRKQDDASLKTFMREVAILERLKHPHICYLKETFQEMYAVNLVLEYVNGGDLLDYVISRGGLSENETRFLTYQLCDALKYIHSKGIAHRDLKPENILLTKDDPPILKIADFGLAKAVDSMTKFKTTCGTPIYLAPEVILRNQQEAYSSVVDSWSVGVIIYSMIANCNPFVDNEESAMQIRFRSRYIDWSSLHQKNISRECDDFIHKLLEEDPTQRMTCAEALNHPWLLPLSNNNVVPRTPPPVIDASDASFSSVLATAGSPEDSLSVMTPLAKPRTIQSAGVSSEFEHIGMEDIEGVEHAAPPSGSQGRQSLMRHPMEVAERDAEGHLQFFEVITPVPVDGAGPSGNEEDDGPGVAESLKRKERSLSLMEQDFVHDGRVAMDVNGNEGANGGGGSDSSLTPVSEDEPVPVRILRKSNRQKKKAAPPSLPAPQRVLRGRAQKRTRAATRKGASRDVDM